MSIITTKDDLKNYCSDSSILGYVQSVFEDSANRKRIFDLPLGAFERYFFHKTLFALEQVFITKARNTCFWETHQRYIDIQIVLDGIEQMEHIHVSKMSVQTPYNAVKDLAVYEDNMKSNKLVLEAGDIAIFFPEDAHMGLPMYENTPSMVHKTVIKLPVEMWNKK